MRGTPKPHVPLISKLQLFIAFSIVAYAIYFPAMTGEFIADDVYYVQGNRYIQDLSLEHIGVIFDPFGALPRVVENYAPVHLLLHGIAWQAFGPDVRGHHLVNTAMHALAAFLLVALFRRTGIPSLAAVLGGAFFLVHPANVEAVAWINQLKTTSAMVLCVGAILMHPRRPAIAAILFGLALLAKPTAAAALFFVVALGLARATAPSAGARDVDESEDSDAVPRDWHWRWLAVWGVLLAVFAVPEFWAFGQTAGQHKVAEPDAVLRLGTTLTVAARYVAMATTAFGLSVFQEPDSPVSLLDPWLLASLPLLAVLGWRAVTTLRNRSVEGAYWVWAAASFAPVCGFIPLPHAIADRYLYFILPGFIGGTLLAGDALLRRADAPALRTRVERVSIGLAVLWIGVFGVASHLRAFVWTSQQTIVADVIAHYPNGRWASAELAARAAEAGDAERAVNLLRAARERGFDELDLLLAPRYAAIATDAEFVDLKREIAAAWVARVSAIREPSQSDLMVAVQAYIVLGQFEDARANLQRAIYIGGPMTDHLYDALDRLQTVERAQAAKR